MSFIQHLIVSILCLFAFATQAHANYACIHSDHLGSTSWITDDNAQPVQYIHYAPYGELIANQRATSFDVRYKFTGKERDAESNYDNFGARYWWSSGGHWLSVDPLADTYIASTPYMYCNGNPIKYIDPNGMWIETAWDVANVAMDAVSLATNVKNGNTRDAVADGIGLVFDVAAAIVPFVPGGAGAAIKSIRASDKMVDVSKVTKSVGQGQKVKGVGIYIKPNGGNAKPHGGAKHNGAIDKFIDNLPAEASSVRKNQTQVDIKDKKVGTNRPDVQYNLDGTHYNVEFDNDASRSIEHQKVIENNDPNSQTILILLD